MTFERNYVPLPNAHPTAHDILYHMVHADGVPYDGVPEENVERIHTAVTVVFCLLSTAGIVFSLSCMLFNYLYREKR